MSLSKDDIRSMCMIEAVDAFEDRLLKIKDSVPQEVYKELLLLVEQVHNIHDQLWEDCCKYQTLVRECGHSKK